MSQRWTLEATDVFVRICCLFLVSMPNSIAAAYSQMLHSNVIYTIMFVLHLQKINTRRNQIYNGIE